MLEFPASKERRLMLEQIGLANKIIVRLTVKGHINKDGDKTLIDLCQEYIDSRQELFELKEPKQ